MQAFIVSLGCPKNLTDTELLMGKLKTEGYSFTNNPSKADLILVNTCAFIQSATQESIETIRELAKYKRSGQKQGQIRGRGQGGKCKYLIVAGCLPQRYKHKLPKLLPEVDAFIGTPAGFKDKDEDKIIKATPPWFAYVKIAEGCNNRCSYCAVPMIRGKLKIRPVRDIIDEVKFLAKTGVKEIIYVAQDTTAHPKFLTILRKTAKIKGVKWIRVLYAHPAHVSDKLLDFMAKNKKIAKYIDLPIQHINDKILGKMGRGVSRAKLSNLIEKIRRRKLALRTSVIVGFPGEGEAEFLELLDFIKKVKFQRLGVFTYQREEGTPAYNLRGQVSAKKKEERFHKVMRAQARISRELNTKLIGKTLSVIVERNINGMVVGRSQMDAPDIDGSVFVKSSKSLIPGKVVGVHITGAKTYDLIGCLT
ncbi:MAG: MiaB/RimO family radical SAM methylthiotransferase [Candidatus Saganbacteria bacterium]|nr:MiaB/RimO family radical SAM methylthiotransferase [Candidatus Saganbacteria bacterium]